MTVPARGREGGSRKCCGDAVEVIEVAKASLDHGEQTLAIFRQKALRLASIEGGKLLRQQPPCLRLVIVRVGDEMDLDTPLVAAHCDTHAPAPKAHVRTRFDLALVLARSKKHRLDRRVGAVYSKVQMCVQQALTPGEREELHDAPQA